MPRSIERERGTRRIRAFEMFCMEFSADRLLEFPDNFKDLVVKAQTGESSFGKKTNNKSSSPLLFMLFTQIGIRHLFGDSCLRSKRRRGRVIIACQGTMSMPAQFELPLEALTFEC